MMGILEKNTRLKNIELIQKTWGVEVLVGSGSQNCSALIDIHWLHRAKAHVLTNFSQCNTSSLHSTVCFACFHNVLGPARHANQCRGMGDESCMWHDPSKDHGLVGCTNLRLRAACILAFGWVWHCFAASSCHIGCGEAPLQAKPAWSSNVCAVVVSQH